MRELLKLTYLIVFVTVVTSQFPPPLPFVARQKINLFRNRQNLGETSHVGLSDYNINDDEFSSEKPVIDTTKATSTTAARMLSTRSTSSMTKNGDISRLGETQTRTGQVSSRKIPKKRECGVQVTTNRIVGGNETAIDEFPFLALLYYKSKKNNKLRYKCGGTLINTKTIITAAHCVEGELGRTLEFVRLGEWNTKTEQDCVTIGFNEEDCSDDPIDFKVKNTYIHPARNAVTKTNDMALLILEEEPPYTDFIRPICLPSKAFEPPSTPSQALIVAGWGSVTQFIFVVSDIKMKLKVNHVTYENCRSAYDKYNFAIDEEKQLCAGGERDKGTCAGDSGGPLMFFDAGKLSIVGIVSFGTKPCAEAGIPGVFVNVWSYIDWINQYAV